MSQEDVLQIELSCSTKFLLHSCYELFSSFAICLVGLSLRWDEIIYDRCWRHECRGALCSEASQTACVCAKAAALTHVRTQCKHTICTTHITCINNYIIQHHHIYNILKYYIKINNKKRKSILPYFGYIGKKCRHFFGFCI